MDEYVKKGVRIDSAIFGCGIYFLLCDDDIVYVGQSVCVVARLSWHMTHSPFKFNGLRILPCIKEELGETEAFYIQKLKPIYNKRAPFINGLKISELAKSVDISKLRVKVPPIRGESKHLEVFEYEDDLSGLLP